MVYPDLHETHTAVFTAADKVTVKTLRNQINSKQNSLSQRAFNYLWTLVSFAHLTTGVLSAAVIETSNSRLEELEDLYTAVYERLDSCSYIRVTQKLVANWHGEEKGYIYRLENAYFQQY